MSRDSNSHFQGAVILDDTGTSSDGTGPISYVGFDKSTLGNPDESAGPRIAGEQGGGTPVYSAPRGSIYLPGTGNPTDQFVWHNIGTQITPQWVRLLQDGPTPLPISGIPGIASVITINLQDTGAALTLNTDIVLPVNRQISEVTEIITYKREASGIPTDTLQIVFDPATLNADAFSVPFPLNQTFASPFMGKGTPTDLSQVLTLVAGQTLRFTQAKANAGDNNAVRVVIYCRS